MNDASRFQLVFQSLLDRMAGYSFPCDAGGRVDLNLLEGRRRNDYFFARLMVGRATNAPQVIEPARARGNVAGTLRKGPLQ